jgi:hypothetical protein
VGVGEFRQRDPDGGDWLWQRYDDAMHAGHVKGHPDSDPGKCVHCLEK